MGYTETERRGPYKDVHFPVEDRGDVLHHYLPLLSNRHIANWTSNPKTRIIPILQALAELNFISGTGMHSSPESHQFLHNRVPSHIPNYKLISAAQKFQKKEGIISVKVQILIPNSTSSTGDEGCHSAKRPLILFSLTARLQTQPGLASNRSYASNL